MPVMDFTKGLDMALKRKIIASQNTLSKMANGAQVFDFFIFWFALVAVFGMIKAFMFHPKLGVVGHTLMRASKDLGTFFLIFFLVNVVYTWATSSLFGRRVEAFSTLPLAFFSLFRWFMGDFGRCVLRERECGAFSLLSLSLSLSFFWASSGCLSTKSSFPRPSVSHPCLCLSSSPLLSSSLPRQSHCTASTPFKKSSCLSISV